MVLVYFLPIAAEQTDESGQSVKTVKNQVIVSLDIADWKVTMVATRQGLVMTCCIVQRAIEKFHITTASVPHRKD